MGRRPVPILLGPLTVLSATFFKSSSHRLPGPSTASPAPKVLARPEFAATSVTAEQWLPITAIPRAEVAAWLAWQKARGWTCVAARRSPAPASGPATDHPCPPISAGGTGFPQ